MLTHDSVNCTTLVLCYMFCTTLVRYVYFGDELRSECLNMVHLWKQTL